VNSAPNRIFRPHDLLELSGDATRALVSGAPSWVQLALTPTAWVVVRRSEIKQQIIPVGVRGSTRSQRRVGGVGPDEILQRLAPEDLATRRTWRRTSRIDTMPAIKALDQVAAVLEASGLAWGPCGTVGFELATGRPVTNSTSDLDLLLRMPVAQSRRVCRELLSALQQACPDLRLDVQIETPSGAFALLEYAGGTHIALRSNEGPRLVRDPWLSDPLCAPLLGDQ
jgi:phosphoribosyl-dephospho-CoA transferase